MTTDKYIVGQYETSEIEEAYANDQADTPAAEIENSILSAAIEICRERAKLYVAPATWTAERRPDHTILVKRIRN